MLVRVQRNNLHEGQRVIFRSFQIYYDFSSTVYFSRDLMVNFHFQMKELHLCQIILFLSLTHSTYFEFLFYTNALYIELSVILVTQVKVKPNNIQSCIESLYTKCYFAIN